MMSVGDDAADDDGGLRRRPQEDDDELFKAEPKSRKKGPT